MAEYIERDEGMDIGTLEDWYINSIDTTVPPIWTIEHLEELLEDFIVIPKETPAADVRPERHGRWILDDSDEYANHYHCSRCGAEKDTCNEIYYESPPNYCENCGAKMDGKDGENDG